MTTYPERFDVKELVELDIEELTGLHLALSEDKRRVDDAIAVKNGTKTLGECKE